jgi:molecular chaperone Hsp33
MQCDSELQVRGMARAEGAEAVTGLTSLVGSGRIAVTIDPGVGQDRYQGIVPLEGETLAASLEAYFRNSEQLATRLWLGVVGGSAVGLMLQRLPGESGDDETWRTLEILADTVTGDELVELSAADLLRRLFAEYDLRLFEPRPVSHDCRCTRRHLEGVLRLLGRRELDSIVAEQGEVELTCEFCNRSFTFDPPEIDAALAGDDPDPTLH